LLNKLGRSINPSASVNEGIAEPISLTQGRVAKTLGLCRVTEGWLVLNGNKW